MRILIFTAATGGGHKRTAKAMEEYFELRLPNSQVQVVDAIKRFIPSFDHEEKGKNLDQKM